MPDSNLWTSENTVMTRKLSSVDKQSLTSGPKVEEPGRFVAISFYQPKPPVNLLFQALFPEWHFNGKDSFIK